MKARIDAWGDRGWLVTVDVDSIEAANRRVHALRAAIEARRPPWLQDLVPAYASLALVVDGHAARGQAACLAEARAWLERLLASAPDAEAGTLGRRVDIPVCYAPEFGPDLGAWAAHCGLEVEAAISRHTAGDYRVAMLGFSPGFPYLLGLDPALAMPRLATPRPHVAAGSVGVGGSQTGAYPAAGPGGWRLLGRTPLRLFDPQRAEPALLAPGDHVRFVRIDRAGFDALSGAGA
ncbi:5-oxoprolinase subunit PxpB [Arenimonas donghaensis]|uniref:Carboxyltransferase domain-containing protein n=1 Tax=Arenimonas donghaensis DSM 18148 = HO3-R19 TaxID=1121014 RepID=A0A087MKI5_9GAMM|nr:5-oxoprolinase subunit PxpB [Arenimonas donghaensis]KFL37388.1 hypothetical protein N788_09335 [Arenimonas donghaensis DSM 18148 = HO3-R19]